MFNWFLALDPTVQVALVTPLVAALVAIPAWIRVHFTPASEDKQKEYGIKPILIEMSETDQLRIDRMAFIIESLTDTIERLRVQISIISRRDP